MGPHNLIRVSTYESRRGDFGPIDRRQSFGASSIASIVSAAEKLELDRVLLELRNDAESQGDAGVPPAGAESNLSWITGISQR